MTMVALPSSTRLQQSLQQVVQSVRWTYSLFWQLCPQQGVLVWGDGHYNGVIKTRKTVQPMEVSIEDAALHRSQQLRELYESLSAGETNQPMRRPCAALSPEDLTESEWFYLMCASFSFPPGVGLPGKAFTRRRYVWLTRANEADSKVFSRAILAKSAHIQTVVCIPLVDGVLELGSTEKVEEDIGLVQHAKSFFADHQHKPALSEHSTSNANDQSLFHSPPLVIMQQPANADPYGSNQEEDEEEEEEEEDDDDDGDDDEADDNEEEEAVIPAAEPTELLPIEMSEGIRLGSPDYCSNNLDSELQVLAAGHASSGQSDHHQQNSSCQTWHLLDENLYDGIPQSPGDTQFQELSEEDAHYTETVSAILQHNLSRWTDSSSIPCFSYSQISAFSKWSCESDHLLPVLSGGASQWMLKYVLFTVPSHYFKYRDENLPMARDRDSEGASKFQKGTPQELSGSHVLAERRRREKLNERFIILRSLVPFVTKMDKASILGDTIEYVKELRKRIQDLELQNKQIPSEWRHKSVTNHKLSNSEDQSIQTNSGWNRFPLVEKRKIRVLEDGNGTARATKIVQVSIIETDALLELQCPYREGLLLKVMQKLHELLLEITSIQSSSANGTFIAEIRAKVKEIHGRKTSIMEVKKAIYQIFSQY